MSRIRMTAFARAHKRAIRRTTAIGAATLCVVSVVSVTAPAEAAFSSFFEFTDKNVVFNETGTYDWANGHKTNGTEDSTLSTAGGTYSRSGTGGVFDGGHFNGNTTPPTAPTRTNAALNDARIADAQFKVDPLASDSIPACPGGDPTVYTGAGSETNGDPLNSDTFGTGSVPPKDDVANVYALAHVEQGTNEIFFGAERVVNNGDSHLDFEFLQSAVTIPNACSGNFTGNRTQGDFLLSVDFTSGGTFGGTTLYKWLCDKGPGGLTDHTKDGQVCNPTKSGNKGNQHYEVAGNTGITFSVNGTGPVKCGGWVCRNSNGSPSTTLDTNELMEGGVDLNAINFTGCISTFIPHTRSSQSFTAVLKDFEVIGFNTCARPSITTRIASSNGTPLELDNGVATAPLGTTLRDTSQLVGAVGIPTGNVSYALYSDDSCTNLVEDLTPDPNAFVNGAPPMSKTFTFNNAGSYWFKASAVFTDSRNQGTPDSGCDKEPLVIPPATPTISTVIKMEDGTTNPPVNNGVPTVPIGTILRDTSTIANGFNATGSVTYTLYPSVADCQAGTNGTALGTKTVSATTHQAPASNTFTFDNAGDYFFYASYTGDSNNTGPVDSGCSSEPLIVSPNTPAISTAIADANGPLPLVNGKATVDIGAVLHDTSSITGATGTAGGTVTYSLFKNNSCTGTPFQNLTPNPNTVVNHVAPDSNTFTFTDAGDYWFYVVYSGDANNTGPVNSGCASEPLTVRPNTPSISTRIADANGLLPLDQNGVAHVNIGAVLHDTSTISGATSTAGGTVTYSLFKNNSCTGTPFQNLTPNPNTVTNHLAPDSNTFTFNAAGTYWFYVVYSGDANNTGPVNSGCASEPVVVAPNTPTITTVIKKQNGTLPPVVNNVPTVPIGTVLHDTSTLAGATSDAGGTVTYSLFKNATCTGTPFQNLTPNPNTVTNGVTPNSTDFTFADAGDYWFYVVYSGDANNTGPVNSGCASEPLKVVPNSTTITTAIADANGPLPLVNGLATVNIGAVLHDTATLHGATTTAGGSVTYTLYSSATCTGVVANLSPDNATVTNATVPDSKEFTFTDAGDYWFGVSYTGDANNLGSSSVCSSEPLHVNKNTPAPHSTPIVQIRDTLNVTGFSPNATGNVVVDLYSDNTCTTEVPNVAAATFTVAQAIAGAQTSFVAVTSGDYYYKISYLGDSNNSQFSDCTEKVATTITSKP